MFIKFNSDLGSGNLARFTNIRTLTCQWQVKVITSSGVIVKEFSSFCESSEFLLSIGVVFNR